MWPKWWSQFTEPSVSEAGILECHTVDLSSLLNKGFDNSPLFLSIIGGRVHSHGLFFQYSLESVT